MVIERQNVVQVDEGGGAGVDGYVVVDGTVDMEEQSVVRLVQEPQPLMLYVIVKLNAFQIGSSFSLYLIIVFFEFSKFRFFRSLPDQMQQGPIELIVAQVVHDDQGQVVLQLVNEGVLVPGTPVEQGQNMAQGLAVAMSEFFDATPADQGGHFEDHSLPEQVILPTRMIIKIKIAKIKKIFECY